MSVWNHYNKATTSTEARELVQKAAKIAPMGEALDLGCGAGNESRYLKELGYIVTSVDSNEGVQKIMPDVVISKFEDFEFTDNKYALVCAMFALPFCKPTHINRVITSVAASIVPRGVFVGTFFGNDDTWRGRPDMSFHAREDIEKYFSDWKLSIAEKKFNKETALGEPHFWHIYEVIAVKK
jgi:SAM-dependent methyltransferase